MSDSQFQENQITQANKENKQEESNINTLNVQNKEVERNQPTNNQESNDDLKKGQYRLTPLESIIINQKMPSGFKLETEENILKSLETNKNQNKKIKNTAKHKERGIRDTHRIGGTIPKKRNPNINGVDNNIQNNITPEMNNLYKKCKKGLEKIKECKYSSSYYQSNNPGVPCLANVEKKVNNYEYKHLYDFMVDVRNIWGYFYNSEEKKEVISKLSSEWEKICEELENQNNDVSVKNIRKRADILRKELEVYKGNGTTRENLPAPVKKTNQQNNEKNMTVEEKNQLGNNIRTLNKEQLKGIIKILSDNNSMPKSKYFEFDIDKLPNKKLRELEKYVKECLALNNSSNKNNSSNNNNSNVHNQNTNNKTTNQKDNQNNNKNMNSNSKGNNNSNNNNTNTNQNSLLKSNNKEKNQTQENKESTSAKKLKSSTNKKTEKMNESSSDSESISSDSSLSN